MKRRGGFTLYELLLAFAMALVLIAAVHGLLREQRRFAAWEATSADTHDASRILWTLLTADIDDAVPAAGDILLPAPDSLALRTFVNLGFACIASSSPGVLGVAWSDGAEWTLDDSLMVYTTSGWRVIKPTALLPNPPVGCGTFSVQADEMFAFLSLANGVTIPIGAPVRAFHWRSYHVTNMGSERWLARTERDATELLVGPLTIDGLRFGFVDADGAATSSASTAAALNLVAQLDRTPVSYAWSSVRDTLRMSIRVQNR